jgi:hypothetical protein
MSCRSVVATLFWARNVAHFMHLDTKSYEEHVALGKLYEGLEEAADDLAELFQGRYERLSKESSDIEMDFNGDSAKKFVDALMKYLEGKGQEHVASYKNRAIQNRYDELLGFIYKIRYLLTLE